MSKSYVTPTAASVTSLLGMILGDDLRASDSSIGEISGDRLATLIDAEDQLVAVCVCDLEFVTYSGAALSMIPAAGANDMLAEKTVTDAIAGNFHEVMNICTKLLMSDDSAHLRLDKTMAGEQGVETLSTVQSYASQFGFEIDIPGYGKGKMGFYIH